MASLLIRHLTEETKRALRIRAAENGRSLSEEAASLIKSSLNSASEAGKNWVTDMLKGLQRIGAGKIEVQSRDIYVVGELPDFSRPEFGE